MDELSRLVAGATSRRLALGVAAAAGGLALAGEAEAKKDASAEKWRRKRGRRGKKGPQGPKGPGGPTGPSGPVSGADAVLVTHTCTLGAGDGGEVGSAEGCQALCDSGYVAVGGGFQSPGLFAALARVHGSFPLQDGTNPPNGWETSLEYVAIGDFDVTTYVICLPA
jgi:hypothetical protein